MTRTPHPLAAAFRAAGWMPDGRTLALAGPGERLAADLAATGPAGVFTRLYELGYPVDEAAARDAHGEAAWASAWEAGFLAHDEAGRVICPGVLARVGEGKDGVWVAGDRDLTTHTRALSADHVSALTNAALTLRHLVGSEVRGRVLDLGCGSGIQSLPLGRHAQVVATDVCERALDLTRRNAELNGVELDVRCGSLYEPVVGETFDLICSNAPFVITPPGEGDRLVYRDSGFAGDSFVEALIAGAPAHLAAGGTLILLANWLVTDSTDPTARVRGWLEASGLDGWVLARDHMPVTDYACHWVRDAGWSGEAARRAERDWARWLAASGASAVGMGIVCAGAPGDAGRTRVRGDVAHVGQPLPEARDIAAILAGLRVSAETDDEDLGASRPRPRAAVKESRVLQLGTGLIESHTLVTCGTDRALGQVSMDMAGAAVIGALDGDLTVDQAAIAVAALCDLEADDVRDAARLLVRETIERGLYVLADD